MAKPRRKAWALSKKLVCGIASLTLAAGLLPASAFAAVNVNDDGKVVYTLPTEPMAVQWQATDANGNEYTYENLTVSLSSPPMQKPYYSLLGISNTSLGRTIAGGGFTETEYGLFGSDANINPDEYLYNYCVTIANPDAIVPADIRSGTESTFGVEINGTTYNIPRAIYTETNMLNVSADQTSGDYTYAQWVQKENERPGRSKTTPYNPTYIKFSTNAGGTYRMVESIYSIAEAADKQIIASADANGNYTYRTRYADGPDTVKTAKAFEDISKGTQYYVLSKLADGSIQQKAVAAVICGYDPNTQNYAVRILDPVNADGTPIAGDKDSNRYAGRITSAVHPIVTDMNTLGLPTQQEAYKNDSVDQTPYVKWYSAEQIIENCDACFTCDAPSSNNVSSYLATASDGKGYDVYSADTSDGNTWANNLGPLLNAQAAAKAAGKPYADVCYKWPKSLFGVWYAQGCENVMMNFITAAYLYPQYFNLTDVMAWWAKNLWHITDASLQDMVDSTCYDISLSTNESQMGTISDDFEATINAMIDAGNTYYLENIAAVDAVADGNIKTHNVYGLAQRAGKSAAEVTATAKAAGYEAEDLANAAAVAGENVFALAEAIGVTTDQAYAIELEHGVSAEQIAADAAAAGVPASDIAAAAINKANEDVAAAEAAQAAAEAAQAAAEAAQAAAEAAQAAAEEQQQAAEAEAEAAKKTAEEAQAAAEAAQKTAEEAQAAAAAAQQAANEAIAQAKAAAEAEAAGKIAEAQAAQKAAEDAQKAAEEAAAAAQAASISPSSLKVTGKTVTAKAKKKSTFAAKKAFGVSGAAGTLTYAKLSGNAKVTVKTNGKVIVKKGLKKGKTVKVKVMVVDAGSDTVAAGTATTTLKVKVK